MLPKITMKAPPHIDGGTVHASDSGKVYNLDEKGQVVVDSVDVRALHGQGFTNVPDVDVTDAAKATLTSVSPTSAVKGAQAIDPAARSATQRTLAETQADAVANQGDHGRASPGHGEPAADTSDPKVQADADRAAEAAKASGMDPNKPSAQAETGGPNQQAGTATQQDKAAEKAEV